MKRVEYKSYDKDKVSPLGKTIRKFRRAEGLNLREFCELADLTYGSIWRIEKGEGQNLSIKKVEKIAEFFGLDPMKMIMGEYLTYED